jgi:hypothetical protein
MTVQLQEREVQTAMEGEEMGVGVGVGVGVEKVVAGQMEAVHSLEQSLVAEAAVGGGTLAWDIVEGPDR